MPRDVRRYPALAPRGLGREMAALYVGVSPGKFDEMVADGRMPRPKIVDRRRLWDREAVDLAFASLPSDEPENTWSDVA